jgi:hypothetical protein
MSWPADIAPPVTTVSSSAVRESTTMVLADIPKSSGPDVGVFAVIAALVVIVIVIAVVVALIRSSKRNDPPGPPGA